MDALNFEYPDYERLDRGVEGQKRKRVASVQNKEAAKLVKDDEEKLKKRKLRPEPKTDASKKRKVAAPKQKATDIEEETAATPSATDVEEILKVMNESLPIKQSPLGPHLTKLFQKEKQPSITKKTAGPKNEELLQ
jgi:formate dehydrogenase assembly factor FdhD